MVVETRFQILGDSLIPTAPGGHGCLRRLPPLSSLARAEFMVNVEELGRHGSGPPRRLILTVHEGSASRMANRPQSRRPQAQATLLPLDSPRSHAAGHACLPHPVAVHLADPELRCVAGTGESRRRQRRS